MFPGSGSIAWATPPTARPTPSYCGSRTSTPTFGPTRLRSRRPAPRSTTTPPTATSPFPATSDFGARSPRHVGRGAREIDWRRTLITAGGLNGILNVLLATLEPGDEVVLTDPVYAGLLNRVRVAGGVPRLARLEPTAAGWHFDPESLRAAVTDRTRVVR